MNTELEHENFVGKILRDLHTSIAETKLIIQSANLIDTETLALYKDTIAFDKGLVTLLRKAQKFAIDELDISDNSMPEDLQGNDLIRCQGMPYPTFTIEWSKFTIEKNQNLSKDENNFLRTLAVLVASTDDCLTVFPKDIIDKYFPDDVYTNRGYLLWDFILLEDNVTINPYPLGGILYQPVLGLQNLEFFTVLRASYGKNWEEECLKDSQDPNTVAKSIIELSISKVLNFCWLVNSPAVYQDKCRPKKLNPLDRKKPKEFFEYKQLRITVPKVAIESTGLGGHHASPREHERIGHFRRYKTGKMVWVRHSVINKGKTQGVIQKDYKVVTQPILTVVPKQEKTNGEKTTTS